MSRKCCNHWEKSKINYTNQRHLRTKVTPDTDFTDEPVVQYDIPVVGNTFVGDCKENDKNDK